MNSLEMIVAKHGRLWTDDEWQEVVYAYNRIAIQILRRAFPTLSSEDYEDIYQDVMVRLQDYPFDPARAQFKTYLERLLRQCAIAFLRRNRILNNAVIIDSGAEDEPGASPIVDTAAGPEEIAHESEVEQAVMACLTPQQRAIWQAKLDYGRGYAQFIGSKLGMTPGNVRVTLCRIEHELPFCLHCQLCRKPQHAAWRTLKKREWKLRDAEIKSCLKQLLGGQAN